MIIVTGGLGFIGNELVRQLKSDNQEVAIIDNKNRVAPDIDDLKDIPLYELNVNDKSEIESLFRELKPDIVFHLAAIHFIPECNNDPERTLRVNVEGTQCIINAASKAGVHKILFASSGAVYDDSPDKLNEMSPVAPVDIYGQSKLFGEHLCELNSSIYGTPITICRLFNNYGLRETNMHIIPEILRQIKSGSELKLGKISTVRDYINTMDCASALIKLSKVNNKGVETVNVATGIGYTVKEIIDIIGEITGNPIKVQLDSTRLRQFDKQIQIADISRLKTLTGWEPSRDIKTGLAELLKYEGFIN
jgi:UDP-glucose 4-epimerase